MHSTKSRFRNLMRPWGLCLLFVLSVISFPVSLMADDAQALLLKADRIRNPADDFEMTIDVKTTDSQMTFQVLLKGDSKTMIVTKSPDKDRGRNMLMLDRDFYAYVPNLKRSVRLSLMQKLSGQVANGDIARTRWVGDYKPTIEKKTPTEIVLFLEGTKPNLTYQKMRLWIDAKSNRPLHAEYLGLDGKNILKKASFLTYKQLAGAERPSQIKIEDATGTASTITIKSMESKSKPDSFFTDRNMESLR